MQRMFKISPGFWCDGLFYACGLIIIDPLKSEKFLKLKHGCRDDEDEFESINDFVLRIWSKEGVTSLERATKGRL